MRITTPMPGPRCLYSSLAKPTNVSTNRIPAARHGRNTHLLWGVSRGSGVGFWRGVHMGQIRKQTGVLVRRGETDSPQTSGGSGQAEGEILYNGT